jgi:hypothetical protein
MKKRTQMHGVGLCALEGEGTEFRSGANLRYEPKLRLIGHLKKRTQRRLDLPA